MKTYQLLFTSLVVLTVACSPKTEQKFETAKPATATTDESVIAVKLAPVQTVTRAEPIVATGLVSSSQEARLSFKIGGIINRTYVDEGQTVQKGQLLATLNTTEIDAQVSQARFSAEKAARDLNRAKALYADTAATLEQLQNATTGQDVARQSLTIAEFNRNYAQIRASVAGTVTRKLMNDGEFAAAGAGVYLISGNRAADWVVRVGVSDKDWARLRIGNRASLTLDAYPGKTFPGTIIELAQSADLQTKLYQAEIRIQPNGAKMAPGLFAKVSLTPAQSRSYAVVPVEAIVEGNGKNGFVYVLADDRKKVRRLPVQIGFLDGPNVLLTNGLSGVAEVVTAGSAFLTESSAVLVK